MTDSELRAIISNSCDNAAAHFRLNVDKLYKEYLDTQVAHGAFYDALQDALPSFVEKVLYDTLKVLISVDVD